MLKLANFRIALLQTCSKLDQTVFQNCRVSSVFAKASSTVDFRSSNVLGSYYGGKQLLEYVFILINILLNQCIPVGTDFWAAIYVIWLLSTWTVVP
jgi:hypothetical protein